MPMLPADHKDALQEYKAATSLINTQEYKIYFIQVAPLVTLLFACCHGGDRSLPLKKEGERCHQTWCLMGTRFFFWRV